MKLVKKLLDLWQNVTYAFFVKTTFNEKSKAEVVHLFSEEEEKINCWSSFLAESQLIAFHITLTLFLTMKSSFIHEII